MSRIDDIMNRRVSKEGQAKIKALAEVSGEAGTAKEKAPELPAVNESENDTEYLGAIVTAYYKHFQKVSKKDAAVLTLSACLLKSNAVIALSIKEKSK
jgi:hypothetical protein